MREGKTKSGSILRFLASGGWADQDPDIMAELLEQAHELATLVAADEGASNETRDRARRFLAQLEADTLR